VQNKPAQGNALGKSSIRDKALKGRNNVRRPFRALSFFDRDTQGGARSSLALGWLVAGPLALRAVAERLALSAVAERLAVGAVAERLAVGAVAELLAVGAVFAVDDHGALDRREVDHPARGVHAADDHFQRVAEFERALRAAVHE
jgi:hypothetical protein